MSSIYTDNFTQILHRVNSRSGIESRASVKTDKNRDEFAKLLASVENNKTIQNNPTKRDASQSPEVLTNIVSEPETYYRKLEGKIPSDAFSGTVIGDMPLDELDEKSVNKPSGSDNLVTPGRSENQLLPVKDRIEPPTVKSAPTDKVAKTEIKTFDIKEIKNIITTAGKYHGVDPGLGLAIAQVESAFNPNAVSKDGFASKGIFQLLDSTAEDMHELTGMKEPYQPFDPGMNSFLGMGYLRRLLDIFSQDSQITNSTKTIAAKSASELEKIAVAAYNAGEGNVARAQEYAKSQGKDPSLFSSIEPHLPAITRSYVKKVSSLRGKFENSPLEEDQG
jgi:hypothetical protein